MWLGFVNRETDDSRIFPVLSVRYLVALPPCGQGHSNRFMFDGFVAISVSCPAGKTNKNRILQRFYPSPIPSATYTLRTRDVVPSGATFLLGSKGFS